MVGRTIETHKSWTLSKVCASAVGYFGAFVRALGRTNILKRRITRQIPRARYELGIEETTGEKKLS